MRKEIRWCCPGQAALLVMAATRHAKVVGLIPGPGTDRGQPVSASVSGRTNGCFSHVNKFEKLGKQKKQLVARAPSPRTAGWGVPRSRDPQIWCLMRVYLLVQVVTLLCPHMQKGGGSSGASLSSALIPALRAPPSWPHHPQRPCLLIPSRWGRDFSTWIWGDRPSEQTTAVP